MGKTKVQEQNRSKQARRNAARRKRYRDRMITIYRTRGEDAPRLGRKLRKLAKQGRLS